MRGNRVASWAAPTVAVLLVAAAAVVAGVVLTGATPRPAPAGLPDAGPVTGWSLPLVRAFLDVAAVGTIGTLLVAGCLVPADGGRLGDVGLRLLRAAGTWAGVWSMSAVALAVASTSSLAAVPLSEVLTSTALVEFGWSLPEGRALLVIALASLALAVWCGSVRGVAATRALLAVSLAALCPLLVTGHAAAASNHFLASQTLLVHVLAATLWFGGLAALALHVRGDVAALRVAVPRFSRLALVCYMAVAASGVAGAWVRLGLDPAVWRSTYGALLLAKAATLVLLGGLGWLHRKRTVAAVVAGRRAAFLRLASVEAGVMAAAVGLAVVLSRTAPPAAAVARVAPPHVNKFPTVDRNLDPFDVWQLVTAARPDPLILTTGVLAVVGYLAALRVARHEAVAWRAGRTMSFVAGVALSLWALCGGVAAYSSALFSVQVVQFLVMGTAVPVLLSVGRPVELLRLVGAVGTARGALVGRARGVVRDPVNALVLFLVVLAAAYATPVLALSLRSSAGHLTMNLVALAAGLLMSSALIRERRPGLVVLLAGALGVFAARIWSSPSLFGGSWFSDLGWDWSDPVGNQRTGAVIVAASAVVLLLVGAALAAQRRHPVPRAWEASPARASATPPNTT
jgi:putative copper resistance protein D